MKILLVEDDMEISAMLKSFLMTENYEVIAVSDGESACEKFISDDFGLVLLDLMIPKRNGMEVMGKIRESSTVPIIIISAKDTDAYSVKKDGKEIELTAKEFEILKLLLQNPKKVYTKEQIYSLVWNDAYLGDENAVNVHISRLRTKIEEDPRNPGYIVTVWGIGYKAGDL